MIIVFSSPKGEYTADIVYSYILYKGVECNKVNGNDIIGDHRFSFYTDTNKVSMSNKGINWNKVNVVWYRRWYNGIELINTDKLLSINKLTKLKIDTFLHTEFRKASSILFNFIKGKLYNNINETPKFIQLEIAKQVGLEVPKTLITSSKEELVKFYQSNNKNIITKCIGEVTSIEPNNNTYSTYTTSINDCDIENMEDCFNISLFQERLNKDVELRIFFIEDKFYPMAIFSTFNKKTIDDFRHYPSDKPNRNIPFKLPTEIEDKLKEFTHVIKYNNGSIDMILTKEKRYVFLEINPDGQFGMVSQPCNYYLEEKFADILIQKSTHERVKE